MVLRKVKYTNTWIRGRVGGGTSVVDDNEDVGQRRGGTNTASNLNKTSNDQSYESTIINDQHPFKHP
jgi:hypothetical protein